jgi:hypothetical protein
MKGKTEEKKRKPLPGAGFPGSRETRDSIAASAFGPSRANRGHPKDN